MHAFNTKTRGLIMVKKIAMTLLCTVLGSSVYAGNFSTAKGFIGLEVGAATVQGDKAPDFFNDNFDYEGDAIEYGVRIGAQTHEWRTTLAFDYYDSSDDDQNVEKGYLMFDYFFLADEEAAFKPFIGANIGYANYESTDIEGSGFIYGGQVGFAYNVAESLDLDLSYRYSLSDADALDHVSSIVFGFNYLY